MKIHSKQQQQQLLLVLHDKKQKQNKKKIAQKMVIRTSVAVCESPMCLFWGDVEMQIDLK